MDYTRVGWVVSNWGSRPMSRIPRLGHNRIWGDKPFHLRQVVPRIHIDQPQVIARVIHPMPGVTAVAVARIDRRRLLPGIARDVDEGHAQFGSCPAGNVT